jgi:hypothetical protein
MLQKKGTEKNISYVKNISIFYSIIQADRGFATDEVSFLSLFFLVT